MLAPPDDETGQPLRWQQHRPSVHLASHAHVSHFHPCHIDGTMAIALLNGVTDAAGITAAIERLRRWGLFHALSSLFDMTLQALVPRFIIKFVKVS